MSSMYSAFVYLEPPSSEGSVLNVAFSVFARLPTRNAPPAAPPIINSSTGCRRAAK
jgi:hypothetical protein